MISRLRDELRKLFYLTRSEANGYLVLLVLMAVLLIAPLFFDFFVPNTPFQSKTEQLQADSLLAIWEKDQRIPEPTVVNKTTKVKHIASRRAIPAIKKAKPVKEQKAAPSFDLNQADTSAFKKIYGIGSVLSARIVKFRDKLGGFHKKEQLYEVYGLDSSVVKRTLKRCFIGEDFKPSTIAINTASFKAILAHPYISYEQTKAIVNYRRKHVAFNTINDLKVYGLLDEETFSKVRPYLILENSD